MENETIYLGLAVLAAIVLSAVALETPTQDPFAYRQNITHFSRPTPIPTPTPTPHTSPTPTPTIVPTPQPTLIPPPSIPPTPSPTLVATPSPTPRWMGLGYKCEIPSHLIGEKWVEAYKFQCTCVIRGKWDLGGFFNIFEGCYSTTSSGWRRESCECLETICKARRELC